MRLPEDLHYYTPDEAVEKYCPMSPKRKCDGPDCMAWRWKKGAGRVIFWAESKLTPKPLDHWIRIGDAPAGDMIKGLSGQFIEGPTKGYCGMVKA
jgi:hypothetical protein